MPDTSKLEKLNRELEKSEKKLRKAINDEKALQHQLKQLTRTATLGGGQMKVTVFMIIVGIIFLCIFVGLLTLIVRALLKYIHSKDVRQEKSVVRKSLGEALKVHRTQCKMTQEFVAETIGVSRQAVSKWENGVSHS